MSKRQLKRMLFEFCPFLEKVRAKRRVNRLVDKILFSFDEIKKLEENPTIITELFENKKQNNWWFKEVEHKIMELPHWVNVDEIKMDILFCSLAYGYTPNEYLAYGFKDLSLEERRKFVSDRESVKYAYRLNKCSDMEIFKDKYQTYALFKSYYKRDLIYIESLADYDKFISFIERHDMFVKKNDKASCGRGVELVDLHNSQIENSELFGRFFDEIKKTGEKIILEELVHQSATMAKFNKSSVNTIRCITLKTNEGVVVPFCFMKVGRNGAFVDNGGAGGLLIGIDEKNGVLNSDAIDEYGVKFEKHPDSGITFKGQALPEWGQMMAICVEMAEMIDSAKWIGWDMAHTDNGWVVIEGNGATEVIGPQATSGLGIKARLEDYLKNTKVLF